MPRWQDVFDEVVRERRPALVGYAALFTIDRTDAEDLAHDAIVRTFARPRTLHDAATAEAYIRSAIRSSFVDAARRRRTWHAKAHLFVAGEDARSPEQATAAVLDVRAALAGLPPRERACAVLRYFDDLPVSEIAHELGLSPGAVKRYLSDATARLRVALGPGAVLDEPVGTATAVTLHRHGRSQA